MPTVDSPPPRPSTLLCQLRAPKAHMPREKEASKAVSPFMTYSSWVVTNFCQGSKGGNTDITPPQSRTVSVMLQKEWVGTNYVDIDIYAKYSFHNVSFFLSCCVLYVLHNASVYVHILPIAKYVCIYKIVRMFYELGHVRKII